MRHGYGIELRGTKTDHEADPDFLEEINWALDDIVERGGEVSYSMIDMSRGTEGTHLVITRQTGSASERKKDDRRPTLVSTWPQEKIRAAAREEALLSEEVDGVVLDSFEGLARLARLACYN